MMNSLNGLAIFRQNRFFTTLQIRIESPSNQKIKHLVRLRKSSNYRKDTGLFLVEGKREIEALNAAGRSLKELYFLQNSEEEVGSILEIQTRKQVACFELAEEPMRKISYRGQTSKLVGVAKTWEINLKNHEIKNYDLVLILDEIEKPGNLGAILRTAEAMGVESVLLSDPNVDFYNPNVIRSSMGLFASLKVSWGTKAEVMDWIHKKGFLVVGTSSRAQKSIYEYNFCPKTALLMGSEKKGLGQFWETNADVMVSIPMQGHGSSLNLNCATAGVLMEINRRKMISKTL